MAIYSEFSHEKWRFSIVMLVYQRVNHVKSPNFPLSPPWFRCFFLRRCGGGQKERTREAISKRGSFLVNGYMESMGVGCEQHRRLQTMLFMEVNLVKNHWGGKKWGRPLSREHAGRTLFIFCSVSARSNPLRVTPVVWAIPSCRCPLWGWLGCELMSCKTFFEGRWRGGGTVFKAVPD